MQITSLGLISKFQTDWLKIPLLGEAETTVSLGIKSWLGFSRSDFIWVLLFILDSTFFDVWYRKVCGRQTFEGGKLDEWALLIALVQSER